MTITYTDVLGAFQPAKEISDPRRFSGRGAQLIAGAQLLLAGDHIFVYGARGIGKSSLARQLQIIADGNSQLLKEIESPMADEKLDFATCFIARDESINNINQLLYRLTIDSDCFAKFPYLHELYGAPPPYKELQNLDPDRVSDFWRRASLIAQHHKNGLAIFVDEFELIRAHDGFASFLKAGKEKVMFVVTGIANTEKELVRDHQSIERQLTTGKLPLKEMNETELRAVVDKAEQLIKDEIRFTEDARKELVRCVLGQPYLLHLIGRQSLLEAFGRKRTEVGIDELQNALEHVAENKTDSGLEDRYRRSIGHSMQREIILRAFARHCNPSAHTSQVYPEAELAGVTNPSYYAGELQKEQYGKELSKQSEQYYGFRDRLFQAYVVSTPTRLKKGSSEVVALPDPRSEAELLNFSDVHFGANHFFSGLPIAADSVPTADKPSFEKYVSSAIENEDIRPDALLLSGDITQLGKTSEFALGISAFKAISRKIQEIHGRAPTIVTCPGNHDVNWEIIKGDPEAKYLAFQPYANFRNALTSNPHYGANLPPERIYEVVEISTQPRLLILSFNSAALESPSDHRGYIGEDQLENGLKEAARHPKWNQSVRIAMFHHHLVPVSTLEAKVGPESLLSDAAHVKRALLNNQFSLVVHGHRHHGHAESVGDGTHSMVVVGCGSSGVAQNERGEQPLQFNKISIGLQGTDVRIQIVAYDFSSADRKWLKSKASPLKSFVVPLAKV